MARRKINQQGLGDVGGLLSEFRNKVINGDFSIWQRTNGAGVNVSSGGGIVGPDRWYFRGTSFTGGTIALAHAGKSVSSPWRGRDRINITRTSCTSSQYMRQPIEDLKQFSGKKVTVSAIIQPDNAENVQFRLIASYGTGGSPSSDETVATSSVMVTSSANGYKLTTTLDVPDLSAKTFGTNGNDYLNLDILFNDTANNVIRVSSVSLVLGDATLEDDPFSPRQYSQELALCKWYYEIINVPSASSLCMGEATSTTGGIVNIVYAMKRTTPTLTLSTSLQARNASGSPQTITAWSAIAGRDRCRAVPTTTGLIAGNAFDITCSSDLNSAVIIDAEY